MAQPGIHVDPAALRAAAGGFDSQAGRIASLVSAFTGPARAVNQAFGFLGPSDALEQQYQQAVTSVLDGLGRLERELSDAAAKLRTGADNYAAADRPIVGSG